MPTHRRFLTVPVIVVILLCVITTMAGAAPSTEVIRDIEAGGNSYPDYLTNVNGTLFFSACTTAQGCELWRSNGTQAGTTLVLDINPGASDSDPAVLTNIGGVLYFHANDGVHGLELWRSNGTAAGTYMVSDINPGPPSSFPRNITALGSTIIFAAQDPINGRELWRTGGTSATTSLITDLNPGGFGADPVYVTAMGGNVYFQATNGTTGYELYRSDGTAGGTSIVADINAAGNSFPSYITALGSSIFFRADNGTSGNELWTSNGTLAGTTMVADINATGASAPNALTVMNGILYFQATNGGAINGAELWRSNGTAGGTYMVADINPGTASSNPAGLTVVGSTLFFAANDGTHGSEVWRSDGTAGGTSLVQDIYPGGSAFSSFYRDVIGGTLYFLADAGTGYGIWQASAASGATLTASIMGLNMRDLTAAGSNLFFTATSATLGNELWHLTNSTAASSGSTSSDDPAVIPATGFTPGRVSVLPAQPAASTYSDQGMELEIPSLGVKAPVTGVPADGKWDVTWLGDSVGYLEGTAYPTWDGNSVLAGHLTDANGEPGVFSGLHSLAWGDTVIIHAAQQQYIYQVRSVQEQVDPKNVKAISKHEENPWLTLVTCQGYDEATNSYKWRVVVRAVLMEVK